MEKASNRTLYIAHLPHRRKDVTLEGLPKVLNARAWASWSKEGLYVGLDLFGMGSSEDSIRTLFRGCSDIAECWVAVNILDRLPVVDELSMMLAIDAATRRNPSHSPEFEDFLGKHNVLIERAFGLRIPSYVVSEALAIMKPMAAANGMHSPMSVFRRFPKTIFLDLVDWNPELVLFGIPDPNDDEGRERADQFNLNLYGQEIQQLEQDFGYSMEGDIIRNLLHFLYQLENNGFNAMYTGDVVFGAALALATDSTPTGLTTVSHWLVSAFKNGKSLGTDRQASYYRTMAGIREQFFGLEFS